MEGNGKKLEYAAITLVEKEAERRNKLYTIVIEEASAAWRNFYTNDGFFPSVRIICAIRICLCILSIGCALLSRFGVFCLLVVYFSVVKWVLFWNPHMCTLNHWTWKVQLFSELMHATFFWSLTSKNLSIGYKQRSKIYFTIGAHHSQTNRMLYISFFVYCCVCISLLSLVVIQFFYYCFAFC